MAYYSITSQIIGAAHRVLVVAAAAMVAGGRARKERQTPQQLWVRQPHHMLHRQCEHASCTDRRFKLAVHEMNAHDACRAPLTLRLNGQPALPAAPLAALLLASINDQTPPPPPHCRGWLQCSQARWPRSCCHPPAAQAAPSLTASRHGCPTPDHSCSAARRRSRRRTVSSCRRVSRRWGGSSWRSRHPCPAAVRMPGSVAMCGGKVSAWPSKNKQSSKTQQ